MVTTDFIARVVTDTTTRAHCSGSGWWMGGMWIWWVVASAAVIVGLVWLFRVGLVREPRSDQVALAILERRFAEDEMSSDDYRERKAVLTGVPIGHSQAPVDRRPHGRQVRGPIGSSREESFGSVVGGRTGSENDGCEVRGEGRR